MEEEEGEDGEMRLNRMECQPPRWEKGEEQDGKGGDTKAKK